MRNMRIGNRHVYCYMIPFIFSNVYITIMLEILNVLNNSKYFTGIMMILLNIGSRFVEIKLSDSMEAYVKYNIGKELLIFTIAWMGTRDIIVALTLTAVFIILSEFIFWARI